MSIMITGASAGVGRAVAAAFARRGASIGLLARDRGRLESAREEVESLGGSGLVLPADVSSSEAVEEAAERLEAELGPIEIWINNAFAAVFAPFDGMTPEEFRRVTDVTYLGYVWGTMAALRRMRPRESGVVVQVGSALAWLGIPLQSAYCGAKHAIRGFTDSVRTELLHAKSGVRIVEVHLPAVNTPQFEWARSRMPRKPRPVGPVFQPEVAAEAVVWAATHDRREVFVGFPAARSIEANKVAPGIVDRLAARRGYDGQLTDEPSGERPGNLFEPVSGDYAAHGRFDREAKSFSFQAWLVTKGRSLYAGLVAGVAAQMLGRAIGAWPFDVVLALLVCVALGVLYGWIFDALQRAGWLPGVLLGAAQAAVMFVYVPPLTAALSLPFGAIVGALGSARVAGGSSNGIRHRQWSGRGVKEKAHGTHGAVPPDEPAGSSPRPGRPRRSRSRTE